MKEFPLIAKSVSLCRQFRENFDQLSKTHFCAGSKARAQVGSLQRASEAGAAMLAFRKAHRDVVRLTYCVFQATKLGTTAVNMGEDCCGVRASPAVPEQANGRQASGHSASGSNKDQRHSTKSHKEAAEELQGWIGRRIELFDQFSERHKREVGLCCSCSIACRSPLYSSASSKLSLWTCLADHPLVTRGKKRCGAGDQLLACS